MKSAIILDMRRLPYISIGLRILAVGVLAALLRLSPQPNRLREALEGVTQSLDARLPANAAAYLAQALEYEPWRGDWLLAAGRYAIHGGDHAAAVGYLDEAGKRGLLTPEDWVALGDARRLLGEADEALSAWEKAVETGAPAAEIYRRRLAYDRERQDFAAIVETLKTLTTLEPGNGKLFFEAGLHMAALQPEGALVYLERAAELEPEVARMARKLQGDIRTAQLAEAPAYTLVAAGRCLASFGYWDLAAQAFRQATQIQLDYAEAWAFLGEARQQIGGKETGYAWGDLSQALELDPESLAANLLAAMFWERQGKYEKALDYLQVAVRLEPGNPVVLVELGNAYNAQGDLEKAEAAYRQAVEIEPENVAFRRALVGFLIRHQMQLREQALPIARQAVVLAPQAASALDLLGETLFLLGDYYGARRILESAVQMDPEYAPALMHLGVVMLYLEERAQARQLIEQARGLAVDAYTIEQSQRLLEYYFP